MSTPTDNSRPFGYRFAIAVLRPLLMAPHPAATGRAPSTCRPTAAGSSARTTSRTSTRSPSRTSSSTTGRSPRFLGKNEVFRVPVVGAVLRSADQIPVYRESGRAADAYRAAVAAVRAGKCVAIYPEGTLTRDPDLWPMRGKTGAARVALETRCPVVPVAVWGPQDLLAAVREAPAPGPAHRRCRSGPVRRSTSTTSTTCR